MDSLDYLPFGEQVAGDTGSTHKFTGKERDAESGLDFFGARYDSSSLGRFMSPHPGAFDFYNPQSLNLYAYTLNNPLFYIDPDGEQSISAVYRLGRVSTHVFVPTGQVFDPAALPATPRGGFKHLPLRNLRNAQAMATARELDTGGGGCFPVCIATFREVAVGLSLSLSFSYDEKTGEITSANIQAEIDPNAKFIGCYPPAHRAAILGMTPQPEVFGVSIDRSVLQKLSPAQLQALARAAEDRKDSISKAIAEAVKREQERRAEEERKRQEEATRRKCLQDGKKDCVL